MSEDTKPTQPLVLRDTREGVTTLTMNNPRRLNGWTMPMLMALKDALAQAAGDEATQVVILTGADPYYCAGVNLSAVIKLDHPAKLHAFIREQNQQLFEMFINFPKPLIAAVNGPAIGASVTSTTLCDATLASDKATFSTPFARLGVPPEGCSSVVFPKLLGHQPAERMMGRDAWQPTGAEAVEVHLADRVIPHDHLLDEAHALAQQWVDQGRTGRTYRAGLTQQELLEVNAQESERLATAFLSADFLRGQYDFLRAKKKTGPALVFLALLITRPLWSKLLP